MRPFGIIRLSLLVGLCLAICTGAPGHLSFALAESGGGRGVDLLARASKAYEAGAYSDAAASIDEAFKAGLTGELAARAILLRAQINERNGKLASALQDYSNALWMESLPGSERKTASEGKERVMGAMGLASPSGARQTAGSDPRPAPQSSSSGVLGVFDGLFGSSTPTKPATPPPAEPQKNWQTATAAPPAAAPTPPSKDPAPAPVKPAQPQKVAKVAKPDPAPAPVAKAASLQPVSASSVAPNADGFLIIFGSVNSQAAGQSKAKQIKAQLSDILVNRELDVEAGPSGGFQIVAGPYKSKSAALALCSAMKQRGVGCQVTP
jgi:hypothetical protein